jgi:hypothetical protein
VGAGILTGEDVTQFVTQVEFLQEKWEEFARVLQEIEHKRIAKAFLVQRSERMVSF